MKKNSASKNGIRKPTREEAENAVRTLILWIGENPDREGLKDTPKRVVRSYEELFSGYNQKPEDILTSFFEEIQDYQDPIHIQNIPFFSHCEHHLVPIIGKAHIAYIPEKGKVIGLSKIPRIVDLFAKRMQTQEMLTAQISNSLMNLIKPKGIACFIEAEHMCIAMRGIKKQGSATITTSFHGCYKEDLELRKQFLKVCDR